MEYVGLGNKKPAGECKLLLKIFWMRNYFGFLLLPDGFLRCLFLFLCDFFLFSFIISFILILGMGAIFL